MDNTDEVPMGLKLNIERIKKIRPIKKERTLKIEAYEFVEIISIGSKPFVSSSKPKS